MPTGEIIVVGKLGSPYGVRGWLHVKSFTAPPANLSSYQPWYLRRGKGEWRAAALDVCRAHKSGFVAKFVDLDDRDAAAELTGMEIGVPRSVLPPVEADEFYWRDLHGAAVVGLDGVELGDVKGFLETGAHDVMAVGQKGRKDILIPFVAQYIVQVDLDARRVTVDWQADW